MAKHTRGAVRITEFAALNIDMRITIVTSLATAGLMTVASAVAATRFERATPSAPSAAT